MVCGRLCPPCMVPAGNNKKDSMNSNTGQSSQPRPAPRSVVMENVRKWRMEHGLDSRPGRRVFNRRINTIGSAMEKGAAHENR